MGMMIKKCRVYLDYAAATPTDPQVVAAAQPFLTEKFYNPSALYLAGRELRRHLDEARHSIAQVFGCGRGEVVFTAGATEANNLAIQGIMKRFPDSEVAISAVEHESVLAAAKLFRYRLIPVDEKGVVGVKEVEKAIRSKTILVSIMLVNNEVGSVQPLREIARLVKAERAKRRSVGNELPIYLHTDAAQAGNYFDLHVDRLGVDLLTINGGKLYGFKQTGALYVRASLNLQPLILGGGQEAGLRSGTENVAGAVGLAVALSLAQQKKTEEAKRLTTLRDLFIDQVLEKIPDTRLNGPKTRRSPNNAHFTFAGCDNERLLMELDEVGIECATGSACNASSELPSHVLAAMGMNEAEAPSSIRFTLGRSTTESDIRYTVTQLTSLLSVKR